MNILASLSEKADEPAGTYVGCKVSPFEEAHRELFQAIVGLEGSKVPAKKLHTTVIYSKKYVDPKLLEPALEGYNQQPLQGTIIGAAAFDALPKADGTRADDVATLVIKLKCDPLLELHAALKELGCTHTYPELSPHVSLFYGVPKEECHAAVERLNTAISKLTEPLTVELHSLYAEPIKQDWAEKNTTKR